MYAAFPSASYWKRSYYPLFQNTIKDILGGKIELINTGEKTAQYLKNYLENNKLENTSLEKPNYQFYLTDTESKFKDIANQLLNNSYRIEKIYKAAM